MARITMCRLAERCSAKERCHRYTETADKWQSWMDFSPEDGESCIGFHNNAKPLPKPRNQKKPKK